MPDMTAPIKLGADIWNQYTDWPAFKAAVKSAVITWRSRLRAAATMPAFCRSAKGRVVEAR